MAEDDKAIDEKATQEVHDMATGFCLVTAHLALYAGLITKDKTQISRALATTRQLLTSNPGFIDRHKVQAEEFLKDSKEQMGPKSGLILPDGV